MHEVDHFDAPHQYAPLVNLLPIPVLDGGHMLFATIGKLRGQALPISFIATAQNVFLALLFSMVIYVSFFDISRWTHESRAEQPAAAPATGAAAQPAK